MSDLLNSASLVMIPSGYKEDTVYSVVPSDGSGDLSFTRASNGTRVNSAGLVEVVSWNLVPNSQTFASWDTVQISGNTVTITDNFITAPNGTLTAAKVVFGTFDGTGQIFKYFTFSPNQVLNATLYAKVPSGTKVCNFGFFDGSIKNQQKTLTTEWQRIEYTGTIDSTSAVRACWFYGQNSETNVEVHLWGGQLNIGSTAKPYFPTTDRLNVPRLTYQNGGGGCPSLLLEKQSTNKVTYSEQFDDAAWNKNNVTITANSVTSPDGTQNADTITDNTTNGSHITYQFGTQTTGTAWTCYMKKGSLNYGYIGAVQSTNLFTTAIINLTNGAIVELQNGSSTTGTVTTEDCGNGWYRVKMQTNANGAGYAIGTSNGAALSGTYKESIYTGTGSGTIYLWGAQLEDSTYATSYIPTTSSSATRVADACSKTGISSLIGQTSGTIFVDFVWQGLGTANVDNPIFSIGEQSYGTSNIAISNYNSALYGRVTNGTSIEAGVAYGSMTIGTRYKCAIGYANNDFIFYVNGVNYGNDTSVSIPALSEAYFQNSYPNSKEVNQAALFKTRLTNAELASLTTI